MFSLSDNVCDCLFLSANTILTYLAYIEWFKPFPLNRECNHLLYKISRAYHDPVAGFCDASIIPVLSIKRSLFLFPYFGPIVPRERILDNVLEKCDTFYVDLFTDSYTYTMI